MEAGELQDGGRVVHDGVDASQLLQHLQPQPCAPLQQGLGPSTLDGGRVVHDAVDARQLLQHLRANQQGLIIPRVCAEHLNVVPSPQNALQPRICAPQH